MIRAELLKPLDGDAEGTIREFDKADFETLLAMGAVREAGEGDGLQSDGPTVADYVAAGYKASAYPPHGYASRSTPEEIAAAIAAEIEADKAAPVVAIETEAEKAAPVVDNKKAPKVLNKALDN